MSLKARLYEAQKEKDQRAEDELNRGLWKEIEEKEKLMKRKVKKKERPQEGDRRIVERILLFPKCLNGEWRWLEIAQIDQEYRAWNDGVGFQYEWVDLGWNTFHDEPLG